MVKCRVCKKKVPESRYKSHTCSSKCYDIAYTNFVRGLDREIKNRTKNRTKPIDLLRHAT